MATAIEELQLPDDLEANREKAVRAVITHFTTPGPFTNCIAPLLMALDWPGEERHLAEALPHFERHMDLFDFLNLFTRLQYENKPLKNILITSLDTRLLPCLFITEQKQVMVVLAARANTVTIFDGTSNKQLVIEQPIKGIAYFFSPKKEETLVVRRQVSWIRRTLTRYKALIYPVFLIGFFMNLLALAVPLFIMAVYDKVVLSESKTMLMEFMIGVGIAVLGIALLQHIRAQILAFMGARLDAVLGSAIFERLLYLSPSYTESATVGAQISRLKDFETIREFVTGPLLALVFEAPFIIIFLVAIGLIGGILVYIPIAMFLIYLGITLAMQPSVRKAVVQNSQANSRRQNFLIEALSNMRVIKYCGAEKIWDNRYNKVSADTNIVSFKSSMLSAATNIVSDVIMIMSGMATMGVGVLLVLKGDMTTGALIATMIFVWRVLGPIRAIFSALTRFDQIRSSARQINMLMSITPERNPEALIRPLTNVHGDIKFNRVSMRYTNEMDPALVGISFDVNHGEVVAVVGRNGAGKSTLLKLIPNMYQIQAGSIRLDDRDIRQIDPIELRHAIGYLPQRTQMFYGTLAQNLRLSNPVATDDELKQACELAGLYKDIMALPEKFETRIRDQWHTQVSDSFQQRMALARVFIKQSPVMLFDEPVNALDHESEKIFLNAIEQLREKSTIFIVTHRPSHLLHVDKILLLHDGHLLLDGPAAEVIPKLPKEFRQ